MQSINNHTYVFLPGWNFKASVFESVIKELVLKKVQLLDLPDHCNTMDDIVVHLSKVIVAPSIIIGWSFGGLIALYLQHKFPQLCKKIILIASTPKFINESEWPGIKKMVANQFLKNIHTNQLHTLKNFYNLVLYPLNTLAIENQLIIHTLSPEKTNLTWLNLLFTLDFRDILKNLNIPLHFIFGQHDAILPSLRLNHLTKLNAQTKTHVISEAGHIPFLTHTREFSAIFKKILVAETSSIKKIKRCFNRAANTYDQANELQQRIGKKLIIQSVPFIQETGNIIDLGCGTGSNTLILAEKYKYQYNHFYAIDIAEQVLQKAKENLASHSIKIIQQDLQTFDFQNRLFNLIFSNMALHWSDSFKESILNIYKNLASNGVLAFSIPLQNTFSELSMCARNRFLDINTTKELLTEIGFQKIKYSENIIKVNFDSLKSALESIKATGVNCVTKRSNTSLRPNSTLRDLINNSEQSSQAFTLSYHIGYFIARKY